MYILGEYDLMEKKRVRYLELYKLLEKEINSIFEVAAKLGIPWEGEAFKAYIVRLNADSLWLMEAMKRIYGAGAALDIAISNYQKNENEIAQLIGGMNL